MDHSKNYRCLTISQLAFCHEERYIFQERERPSEPTGQAGALVGASSLCKMFSSDFIIVIENPANGIRILSGY
jgi:hypothetical protein